ncbi:MAG: hypothetical protein JW384_04068 [Nitrosomonadaceae bacterium]|nr:hypothetical protein [Nitrosomonadaceae bacterium]
MYAIRRHKAALNAWCWRVHFRRRGILYFKSFYDINCGGSKKAKTLAVAWRDEQLEKQKTFTVLEFHKQKRSNNVSGVPGVHYQKSRAQPTGFWQANLKLHSGKRLSKTFSVQKFGHQEAFRLAVAARNELLLKIEDRPYLYHSAAKKLSGSRQGKKNGGTP